MSVEPAGFVAPSVIEAMGASEEKAVRRTGDWPTWAAELTDGIL